MALSDSGSRPTSQASDFQRVESLFAEIEVLEPTARQAAIEAALGDRPDLQAEIASLLAAHDRLTNARKADEAEESEATMIGTRVGAYRLTAKIGEGGMGEVFRAERADGLFTQAVAVKLTRSTISHSEARRRFDQERQILASLNHEHIVRLLDGGTLATGQAFLIMEHVEGAPLTRYCGEHALSLENRLALFVKVCGAVEYAHQHGVIHRDLKPANLLVDRDGEPKIVDFGIAKLLERENTTGFTSTGMPGPLTPNYASPEQLRGLPVTAASDVYSLGVLLYEVVTGVRPYETDGQPLERVLALVAQEPPARPSAASVSQTLPYPRARLSSDIDAIVLKALGKEPADRYDSARALASDLERYLAGDPVQARPPSSGYLLRRLFARHTGLAAAALLVLALGAVLWRSSAVAGDDAAIQAVAVLPLENLSADGDADYFAEGITDALIADLAQIQALKVISRTSVMGYKQPRRPLPEIARELGVDAVVEGSVRRVDQRVRVNVQLVHAATDRSLWTQTYERNVDDILSMEREIARSVAIAVRAALTPEERSRLARTRSTDPIAYEAYLKGRHFWNDRSYEGLAQAVKYFKEAIDRDPTWAAPYAGLADCYVLGPGLRISAREANEIARSNATKALELDPELAEAHSALGLVHLFYDWDMQAAGERFRRAIDLSPGYATAHQMYAEYLAINGRLEEAMSAIRRARELDPLSLIITRDVGRIHFFARRYDEAIAELLKTLEMDDTFTPARFLLAFAYERKGQHPQALAEIERILATQGRRALFVGALGYMHGINGDERRAEAIVQELTTTAGGRRPPSYDVALVHLGLGNRDPLFEWLDRAAEERSYRIPYLAAEPIFDPVRDDPRFAALMARAGLSARTFLSK